MEVELSLFEPRWLQFFDVLYRCASVTRAAEQLGVSQPTVSIWLARLREAFGDPLFVRTPGGMQPTPRADALIDTVRAVLDGLRRLAQIDKPFDASTAARAFRIFMTDASHVTLLPRLLTHVRAVAPQVKLEAVGIGTHMAAELESGAADLALGFIPGLEAGFYQQALYQQDWVCLTNGRHPRIKKQLTLADYRREAHVGIVGGTGQRLLEASMKERHVARDVALKLPGFLGLPAIVATTDLIATLPRHIGETLAMSAGLRIFPCPVSIPTFVVKQHWHARFHHDPANMWLRGVCASLFMDATVIRRAGAS